MIENEVNLFLDLVLFFKVLVGFLEMQKLGLFLVKLKRLRFEIGNGWDKVDFCLLSLLLGVLQLSWCRILNLWFNCLSFDLQSIILLPYSKCRIPCSIFKSFIILHNLRQLATNQKSKSSIIHINQNRNFITRFGLQVDVILLSILPEVSGQLKMIALHELIEYVVIGIRYIKQLSYANCKEAGFIVWANDAWELILWWTILMTERIYPLNKVEVLDSSVLSTRHRISIFCDRQTFVFLLFIQFWIKILHFELLF